LTEAAADRSPQMNPSAHLCSAAFVDRRGQTERYIYGPRRRAGDYKASFASQKRQQQKVADNGPHCICLSLETAFSIASYSCPVKQNIVHATRFRACG